MKLLVYVLAINVLNCMRGFCTDLKMKFFQTFWFEITLLDNNMVFTEKAVVPKLLNSYILKHFNAVIVLFGFYRK